jgi:hypothetical protein
MFSSIPDLSLSAVDIGQLAFEANDINKNLSDELPTSLDVLKCTKG